MKKKDFKIVRIEVMRKERVFDDHEEETLEDLKARKNNSIRRKKRLKKNNKNQQIRSRKIVLSRLRGLKGD